ncbi:hypothetical protein ACQKJC_11705 [Priestia koreensis]|uniref:hypothetical protein n=1 Tax=Priestia koreensis TaxID=284581 RepID=UPI003D050BA3
MEKQEILLHTLLFLKENPFTQYDAVDQNIQSILREKGIIGVRRERRGGGIHTSQVRIEDSAAL